MFKVGDWVQVINNSEIIFQIEEFHYDGSVIHDGLFIEERFLKPYDTSNQTCENCIHISTKCDIFKNNYKYILETRGLEISKNKFTCGLWESIEWENYTIMKNH